MYNTYIIHIIFVITRARPSDGHRDRGMSAKARLSTSPVVIPLFPNITKLLTPSPLPLNPQSRLSSSSSRPASALRSPSPSRYRIFLIMFIPYFSLATFL